MIKELSYSNLNKEVHIKLQHQPIFVNEDMEMLNLENGLSILPLIFDKGINYLYFAVRVETFENLYFNINNDTFYSFYDGTSVVFVLTNDISNKLSRRLQRLMVGV